MNIQSVLDQAGTRARRRIRSGELDPYTGEVGQLMAGWLLADCIRQEVESRLVWEAGLPAGTRLQSVETTTGWELAVTRPRRNGRAVR